MKKRKSKRPFMSYHDRIRGYEQDKQELLYKNANLSAGDFAEKLKALQNKWKI